MVQFVKILIMFFIFNIAYAKSAMQPATVEYEDCNYKGTSCSKSVVEYYIENGNRVAAVSAVVESNEGQLLNLDHFYRNECKKELGLNIIFSKDDISKLGHCLIKKLEIAIENRNIENLDYLNETKDIFK